MVFHADCETQFEIYEKDKIYALLPVEEWK